VILSILSKGNRMFRNRYVLSIFFFVMAMFMFRAASYGGSGGSHLASLNVADVILILLSGACIGFGALALFGKLKIKAPDR